MNLADPAGADHSDINHCLFLRRFVESEFVGIADN
jgi:CelD/BcsL family acetyltransferase involved in cellulose biosynthesis